MRLVVGQEFFLDPCQPFVEQRLRARIQRRKRSDHAGLALCDHEIGHGNDEQRRTDHGDGQTSLEQGRHGHLQAFLFWLYRLELFPFRLNRNGGSLERVDFSLNRHLALSHSWSMFSAQTRSSLVARENRYPPLVSYRERMLIRIKLSP